MATNRAWRVVQKEGGGRGVAAETPKSPSQQQWKPINLPLPRTYAVRAQMENESRLDIGCKGPTDGTYPSPVATTENNKLEDTGNGRTHSHSECQSVDALKERDHSEESCDPFKSDVESRTFEKNECDCLDESSGNAGYRIKAQASTKEAVLENKSRYLCPEAEKAQEDYTDFADAFKVSKFEHAGGEEMDMEKETEAQRLAEESGDQYKEEGMCLEKENDVVEQVGITDAMASEVQIVEEVQMEKETKAQGSAGEFGVEDSEIEKIQVDQTSITAIRKEKWTSTECQYNEERSEGKPIFDNDGEESETIPVQVVKEDGEVAHDESETSVNKTKEDSHKQKGKGKRKGKAKDKEKELWKNKTKGKWQVKGKEKEKNDEICEVNAEKQISKDDEHKTEEENGREDIAASVKVDIPFLKFFTGKRAKSKEKIEKDTQTKIFVPSPSEVKHGSCLVVEGATQENVDRAVSQIHDMLKEAAESANLGYSHFISLPLAIYPAFTEQVIKFHDFVLSLVPVKEDAMENKRRRAGEKVKMELAVPTTETNENLVNLEEIFGKDVVVSDEEIIVLKADKSEDESGSVKKMSCSGGQLVIGTECLPEAEEKELNCKTGTSISRSSRTELDKGVMETDNNERNNNLVEDAFDGQRPGQDNVDVIYDTGVSDVQEKQTHEKDVETRDKYIETDSEQNRQDESIITSIITHIPELEGEQQEELDVMYDEGFCGIKRDVPSHENHELVGKQQDDFDAKYKQPNKSEIGYSVGETNNDQNMNNKITEIQELRDVVCSDSVSEINRGQETNIEEVLRENQEAHGVYTGARNSVGHTNSEQDTNYEVPESQELVEKRQVNVDQGFCEIKEIADEMGTDTNVKSKCGSFPSKSGKNATEENAGKGANERSKDRQVDEMDSEMGDSVVKIINEENRDKNVADMEKGTVDIDDLVDNEEDNEIHRNPGAAGDEIETEIGDSVRKTKNGRGIEESIFIKPTRLHLTILMLKLWNEERVNTAIQVLQELKSKLFDAMGNRPVALHLRGLECMRGSPAKAHVLYAKAEEVDEEKRLKQACNIIREAYIEAGLVSEKEKKQELKLHATLMNTTHRKRRKGKRFSKPIPFDAREIISKYGSEDWGEHRIMEAHLSQRFVYGDDDYYHCCSSIPFPSSPD